MQTRDWGSLDPGPFPDTKEVSGQILVASDSLRSSEQHFHCSYLLSESIAEVSSQAEIRTNLHDWLVTSLDVEWRFLCTLGGFSWIGLRGFDAAFARRYVGAAIRHWPAVVEELHRFEPMFMEDEEVRYPWYTMFSAFEILGLSALERTNIRGGNRRPC